MTDKRKIKLSRFEYDYLIAQREVDIQKVHVDAMIRMGYFKNLAPYFVHEDYGKTASRPDGKLHYVLIGTIRDHIDDFEITDGTPANAEDFMPSEYITTHSDKEIVQNCIRLMDSMLGEFTEYLDYICADNDEMPFECKFSYAEIVSKLLLRGTSHSGGTSTMAKCSELGFDPSEQVVFITKEDKDDE